MSTVINHEVFEVVKNADLISGPESLDRFKAAMADWRAGKPETIAKVLDANIGGLVNKAMHNYTVPAELVDKYVQKGGPAVNGVRRSTVALFSNELNELDIDPYWMKAFEMADLGGAAAGDIIDFNSFVTWNEVGDGAMIPMSEFGNSTYAEIKPKRYGCALPFLNKWLETNQIYNINGAARMMRLKNLEKKANLAYTSIFDTSGVATQTCAGATPADIISALNSAVDTQNQALAGAGLGISVNTPYYFFVNGAHMQLVMRAFDTVRGTDGDNNIIRFPIIPVFTYNSNAPTQIAAKNSGMLVLPGRKNIWATFSPIRMEQENSFRTDSTIIAMQEYFNRQAPAAQRLIVNLQA